jgi:4-hydroxy-2-oxoheptanedioate aldolase
MPREEYFKRANEILVIIQLEGREAIGNLDDILKVEGVDIIFIGPYDLSQSLGVPGQVSNPLVIQEMDKIVKRANALGKVVGTFTDTPQSAEMWRTAGVQYISYSVDVGIFTDACSQLVKRLNP